MGKVNPIIYSAVNEIQREIYMKTYRRTDTHYMEGYGALFVYEGDELTPNNVIYAADETELLMRGL